MFLSLLENAQQRDAFFELAKHIAHADGELGPEEITMLEAYKHEMSLEHDTSTKATRSLDDVVRVFSTSDRKIRHTVFLEALALVLADARQHENELKILLKLRNELDIPTEKEQECRSWLEQLHEVYSKANELLA